MAAEHHSRIGRDRGWTLVYTRFVAAEEGRREALCTLGNGYFATRGAASGADADDIHYPGTYMAGVYNRLETDLAGRAVENEDLVNLPNWLSLKFRIGTGHWLGLRDVEIMDFSQTLDLRAGVLVRDLCVRDGEGRTTQIVERRLVAMHRRHLGAVEATVTALDWSGSMEIQSALDGRVVNDNVARYRRLNSKHLVPVEAAAVDERTVMLKVATTQSEVRIALAQRTQLFGADGEIRAERRTDTAGPEHIAQAMIVEMAPGRTVRVEKIVALHSGRDRAISECGLAARTSVARAPGFAVLATGHARAWRHLWRRFDIEVRDGQPLADCQVPLRLHLFHLLQTVSPNSMDLDVGVPARGLHGEAYRGHVFWDELFIFPLLNLRIPEITRGLLAYRYNRLEAARAAARAAGLRGAMFPWQSASDGREETQTLHLNPRSGRWSPDNSHLQRHVSAAIAYNAWQYYQVTQDIEFLTYYGADLILEVARLFASLATFDAVHRRYRICGVMGPDEYHDAYPEAEAPGLDDNAYTNVMAVWVLCCALELLETLPADTREELCDRLDLSTEECAHWHDISRRMRIPFHADGVISQFEGYERLSEFDWDGYRDRYGDIQRLDRILEAEGDSPNRYKLSKQADVLMLFYIFSADELAALFARLGYPFGRDLIPRTVDYYAQRTAHGSTLSRVVHSWVLARSDRAGSWRLFLEALASDLADVQGGTTKEGVHLGALAGGVDLVQRGYSGIEARGDTLWFSPCLPDALAGIHMRLRYRGHSLEIGIDRQCLSVRALRGTAERIRIGYKSELRTLAVGETAAFELGA